jgi:hypothetical protein
MKGKTTGPLCNQPKRQGSGELCTRPAGWGTQHVGTGPCKLHGGNALKGIAHPNFQDKGFSKYVGNRRLSELIQEAESNVDLMDARGDLSLLYGRLAYLLDSGESESLWDAVKTSWVDFKTAYASGDAAGASAALDTIDKLIKRGADEVGRWNEIYQVERQMMSVRESVRRQMIELSQMVSVEQMRLLLAVIMHEIKESADMETRRRVSDAIIRLVGSRAGGLIADGGRAATPD